ncbi:unnamed protein product, partial [Iphiclides podalirius]
MFRRRALRRRLAAAGAADVPDDQLRRLARAIDAGPEGAACVPAPALRLPAARALRFPDLRDLAELRRLPRCADHRCCNPHHYSRLCEPVSAAPLCTFAPSAGPWRAAPLESRQSAAARVVNPYRIFVMFYLDARVTRRSVRAYGCARAFVFFHLDACACLHRRRWWRLRWRRWAAARPPTPVAAYCKHCRRRGLLIAADISGGRWSAAAGPGRANLPAEGRAAITAQGHGAGAALPRRLRRRWYASDARLGPARTERFRLVCGLFN